MKYHNGYARSYLFPINNRKASSSRTSILFTFAAFRPVSPVNTTVSTLNHSTSFLPFLKVIPQIFRKFVPQHKNLHYETNFSCIYLSVALCFRSFAGTKSGKEHRTTTDRLFYKLSDELCQYRQVQARSFYSRP